MPSSPSVVLTEARIGVMTAIVAAFGSSVSEVGAVMLVGGNIDGRAVVDFPRPSFAGPVCVVD